ncbi:MAG: hypothetical protein IKM61_00355 [Eubacteriaceae bacterium]|nr:hypothetical protein [Eubacteriaceae bacterium]
MKKRVLSVLLAAMLLVASFASVSAAEAGVSVDKTTAEIGDTVVVTLTIPAINTKLAGVQTGVKFDNTVFEVVKYDCVSMPGVPDPTTMGTWPSLEECQAAGEVTSTYVNFGGENSIDLSKGFALTAELKVLDTAKGGTTEIVVEDFICYEMNGSDSVDHTPQINTKATVTIDVPCAHDWKETAAKVEPTCDEAGKEAVYTCSICGATKGGEEIAALGHKWEVKEKVESTCKDAGYVIEKCSVCGEEKTTALELADHTWGEWVLDEEGTTETRTCEVCGATESREYNPETGDTMMAVLFLAMAATFVVAIAKVNKARKNA